MFRANVNSEPCPQKIQLGVACLHISFVQRGHELLQHVMHRLMIVRQHSTRLIYHPCFGATVGAALRGRPFVEFVQLNFFQLQRFRKQNVVFQMNMLMQILFEILKRCIKRLIANACIGWHFVVRR
jgi:hypothetical protein